MPRSLNQRELRLIESRQGVWNRSDGERFQTRMALSGASQLRR
jgi:hypothetical protein